MLDFTISKDSDLFKIFKNDSELQKAFADTLV